ncbi:MAG: DEAD/DEAH box helicase [Burkholderiales bacterium]|nr:DEAD/DEAH box helicase [Burkholderiales bacterium]
MRYIDELAQQALEDEYLHELFFKIEQIQAETFFQIKTQAIDEKELFDLLRFADIFSRSKIDEAKNRAYKIISLLLDKYSGNAVFQTFANSIMVKLGNFPALSFIEKFSNSDSKLPYEVLYEKSLKEVFQEIPHSKFTFTDSQYHIFEALKNSNHFSFSGPTSLGKSFIINAFIRHLITEHRGTDNLVILVPSRALINQTVSKLKQEFKDVENYTILAHPSVPVMFRKEKIRYIFVFTPERLIAYLSKIDNPKIDYLFVDEAHKVVALKDTRSPLYYHAILQAERKSIKLFFASPNVENPEIFLQLFEKSQDEKIVIKSSPVAQNRYFLDLIENKCLMFSDLNKDYTLNIDFNNDGFFYWLKKLSKDDKNIIYCNSKANTISYALEFSKTQPTRKSNNLDSVKELIKEYLHEKYYLIDCLDKGIAFHFGNLPQLIREKIEWLFEEKEIDYLFCTSTLLEGVNLPAKNIFILANQIGLSKFTDVDFWNLAGRAGRMTKEMSGNIICMRVQENKWNNQKKDLDIVRNKCVKPFEPLMIKGQGKFFENIEASLSSKEFTNKNAAQAEKDIWNYYANLVLIHEIKQDDSVLRTNFIIKNQNALKILQEQKKKISVPERILSASSMIKPKYQNDIYQSQNIQTLSSNFDYSVIVEVLQNLSKYYNWEKEEIGGKNPLYKPSEKIKYYAVLMDSWMKSKPLKMIIANTIEYYKQKGQIWENGSYVSFDHQNKHDINKIINLVISDIDNILRFKLKNYFENYYMLLKEKFGVLNAGANWADFLEYGTTDSKVIELQNIGIARHLAQYILDNHENCLFFENDLLQSIDNDKLYQDFNGASNLYIEFCEFFGFQPKIIITDVNI